MICESLNCSKVLDYKCQLFARSTLPSLRRPPLGAKSLPAVIDVLPLVPARRPSTRQNSSSILSNEQRCEILSAAAANCLVHSIATWNTNEHQWRRRSQSSRWSRNHVVDIRVFKRIELDFTRRGHNRWLQWQFGITPNHHCLLCRPGYVQCLRAYLHDPSDIQPLSWVVLLVIVLLGSGNHPLCTGLSLEAHEHYHRRCEMAGGLLPLDRLVSHDHRTGVGIVVSIASHLERSKVSLSLTTAQQQINECDWESLESPRLTKRGAS